MKDDWLREVKLTFSLKNVTDEINWIQQRRIIENEFSLVDFHWKYSIDLRSIQCL